ncbi:MAG: peptidoglycan-binding protein [Minisyncoccia bacterium]|jgi:peptidoglycan hydrolase-like protein with peptidoglycan-binding domain
MNYLYRTIAARFAVLMYTGLCVLGLCAMPLAFAYASTSVSIQSVSPGTTVLAGNTVSFSVSASGFNNPTYSVSDAFSGSSVLSGDINPSGNFAWTPNTNDAGTHNLSITVSDSSGNSTSLVEQITVTTTQTTSSGVVAVTIQGLTPGTAVVVGNPLTFTAAASSFINPSFTVSDSFVGSSISNADINAGGNFNWTPTANQVGTHVLTVYANDTSGHSANVTETIVVQNPNIAVTSISPGNNINPSATVTFNLTQAGFVNPSYTLSDSFVNTSITNNNINSAGLFTWTPATNQAGTHPLMIYASDSEGHLATTTITLYVIQPVSIALTAPSPSSVVSPGTTVFFNAQAYGFTNPSYAVVDSLSGSSVNNSDINSAGNFNWTPTTKDIGVHTLTVSAVDIYSHFSNAATTITVSNNAAQTTTTSSQTTTASNSTSGFVFINYLSPGITSSDVTQLQTILTQQGYFTGPITGYYGPLTEAAVVAYQAAHGIDQLGVVGPATRAALNSGAASNSSGQASTSASGNGYIFSNFLDVGSTGQDVTELQQRLTSLNLYSGPITGYFGSLTQAAVAAFQGQHNISPVGYVGPATRAALNGN